MQSTESMKEHTFWQSGFFRWLLSAVCQVSQVFRNVHQSNACPAPSLVRMNVLWGSVCRAEAPQCLLICAYSTAKVDEGPVVLPRTYTSTLRPAESERPAESDHGRTYLESWTPVTMSMPLSPRSIHRSRASPFSMAMNGGMGWPTASTNPAPGLSTCMRSSGRNRPRGRLEST